MFTGLIRHTGKLTARGANTLSIDCPELIAAETVALGDSVAVMGACLTVAKLSKAGFRADLLEDTLRNTILGALPIGNRVNLETAMKAGDSFGGHFVQGHVDGIARLSGKSRLASGDWRMSFILEEWLKKQVVDRGSIAINGVSLTVQGINTAQSPATFSVSIIPTTWAETTLSEVQPGEAVNIEADLLVKTVRQSLDQILGGDGLSADQLKKWGYGG